MGATLLKQSANEWLIVNRGAGVAYLRAVVQMITFIFCLLTMCMITLLV